MAKLSSKQQNWLLIVAVLAIAAVPLMFVRGEFGGADGQAEQAIGEINPQYRPWFKPFFEPPGEVESLLFASQAALGAGVIGYVIGRYLGRSERQKQEKKCLHHHLDVYTHANRLRHIVPQQKLLFAIVLLLIALITHSITQLFIAVWLTVWTIGYARIPAKIYWRVLFVTGLFLITSLPAFILDIVSVSQIAAVQSDAIAGIPIGNLYFYCSRSGVLQAFQVVTRSIACTSCLLFVIFTVPFSDLLQVLRQWHVPVLLTELLLLMYRFVFLFLDALTELQLAQRARGGYRTRQAWMRSVGLLVSQLLVRSLHHYHQFTLALAARGFNGSFQIYTNTACRYSKRYAIESLLGCLLLLFFDRTLP